MSQPEEARPKTDETDDVLPGGTARPRGTNTSRRFSGDLTLDEGGQQAARPEEPRPRRASRRSRRAPGRP